MKAVVYKEYGSPDVLQLQDIQKPIPKDNEILVRVHATTVTAGDWRMRKADPFLARLFNGLFRPKKVQILGFELAGVVEEVGSRVQSFRKGDHVFASCGLRFGAYAEYTCLPESDLIAIKPSNMSFEEAATLPIGGLTALGFLRQARIKENDHVMIYGASGSVGTFALQIAKAYRAKVTAVCSTANVHLMRQLGADEIIDYTKDDFTKTGTRFDIVFDAVGKTSRATCRNLLKQGGRFVSVTGSPKSKPGDLLSLKKLTEDGKLITVIDRRHTLEEIREAHAYVESFRKKGNVVVTVTPDDVSVL